MTNRKDGNRSSFDELGQILTSVINQVEKAVDQGLHEANLGGIEGARQRLADVDMDAAMRDVQAWIAMVIDESQAEPWIEDAKSRLADLWQRVESGEIEGAVRTEIISMLRTLQEELDKHFPQDLEDV